MSDELTVEEQLFSLLRKATGHTYLCEKLSKPSRFSKVVHKCARPCGHKGHCRSVWGIWFFHITKQSKLQEQER